MRSETQDPARGTTICEMPLSSAICEPASGAEVKGHAIAMDRAITRVDVPMNGGRHRQQASIEDHGNGRWSWTLWHTTRDIPAGDHDLAVRAWDAAGQTQLAQPDDTWTFKDYLSGAWHRVRVIAN